MHDAVHQSAEPLAAFTEVSQNISCTVDDNKEMQLSL